MRAAGVHRPAGGPDVTGTPRSGDPQPGRGGGRWGAGVAAVGEAVIYGRGTDDGTFKRKRLSL